MSTIVLTKLLICVPSFMGWHENAFKGAELIYSGHLCKDGTTIIIL